MEMLQSQIKLETTQNVSHDTSKTQVYIFLRLTVFIRESGYHEFSIALWHAVLEFVLLRPSSVTESTALDSFGSYWDAECPRLGELGHRGWTQHLEQPDKDITPDPLNIIPEEIRDANQVFTQFGPAELKMAGKLALPGRIVDEVGEDDPFHAILFSDLSSFISCFLADFQAKSALLSGLFCYLGLPPLPANAGSDCREWWQDSYLRTHISNLWLNQPTESGSVSNTKLEFVQMTTEELFYGAYRTGHPFPIQRSWIERTLQTLVQHDTNDDILAEYFLAFLVKQKPGLYVFFLNDPCATR
jgi:hypothetical protein